MNLIQNSKKMFALNITVFLPPGAESKKKLASFRGNCSVRLVMKYVIAGNRRAEQSKGWDHPTCLLAGYVIYSGRGKQKSTLF